MKRLVAATVLFCASLGACGPSKGAARPAEVDVEWPDAAVFAAPTAPTPAMPADAGAIADAQFEAPES